jgi:uncharacterized protein YjiS (DUF1127 family)
MTDFTNPAWRPSYLEIERRANVYRSLLMQAYLQSAAGKIAALLRILAHGCAQLAGHVAAELRLRSDIRTLQQFDDRTLADIGVLRCEIENIVRSGRFAHKPRIAATQPRRKPRPAATAGRTRTSLTPVKAMATVTAR